MTSIPTSNRKHTSNTLNEPTLSCTLSTTVVDYNDINFLKASCKGQVPDIQENIVKRCEELFNHSWRPDQSQIQSIEVYYE